jgi:hypothetical protein
MNKNLPVLLLAAVVAVSSYLFVNGNTMFSRSNAATNQIITPVLPAGFPDIPVYPSTIMTSAIPGSSDGNNYSATWTTAGSVAEIISWYTEHLPGSGWTIDVFPADSRSGSTQYLEAKKGLLTLQLSVLPEIANRMTIIDAKTMIYEEEEEGE